MQLPPIEELILKVPLYEEFALNSELDVEIYLFDLFTFPKTIDSFCPSCVRATTFKRSAKDIITDLPIKKITTTNQFGVVLFRLEDQIRALNFECTRDPKKHFLQATFLVSKHRLIKIGQYPSIAETTLPESRKYRKVLDSEKFKEFTRAIGLVTHGVGIGSFVYLRRIFEMLIEEAHQKLLSELDWDEETYLKSRMAEKIQLLAPELPDFLVENKNLYSILSKGVHDLSEQECLAHFDAVRLGIELILEEKLTAKIKQEKIENAKKSLNKISEDLSKE